MSVSYCKHINERLLKNNLIKTGPPITLHISHLNQYFTVVQSFSITHLPQ